MPTKIYYSLLWVFVASIFYVVYNSTDKYYHKYSITNVLHSKGTHICYKKY